MIMAPNSRSEANAAASWNIVHSIGCFCIFFAMKIIGD
jgi:hypothetical protein